MNLDNKYIFEGQFGLERETLRVDALGRLSRTPHPFPDNDNLDRDFCENQTELITPVCSSIKQLTEAVKELDDTIHNALNQNGEYLWMMSNPPHFETEDDIIVAKFSGDKAFKNDYRLKLQKRYGKRIMLYSGIHFNFSFSEQLIQSEYTSGDYIDFKNRLYLKLAKHMCRYSWLPVLLTAASPVYDLSLNGDGLCGTGFDGLASMRSSDRGYWNKFVPILDYSSIGAYWNSINGLVNNGSLFAVNELYLPVRLKCIGSTDTFDHIELRMLDINPLSPIGIFREDLEFLHYYIIYLSSLPDFDLTPELQEMAVINHKAASKYELSDITISGYSAIDAANGLLDDMLEYFARFDKVCDTILYQKNKLAENKRYCVDVYNKYHKDFHNLFFEHTKSLRDNN